jgi:general secretion pathway protein K
MLYGPGPRNELGVPRFWEPGMPLLLMPFPEGEAAVEVIPESSKLNVNQAPERELMMLMVALGVPPEGAQQIAAAVLNWRGGGGSALDQMYLTRTPSFRAPHASLEQIEELMSIAGITPDLFYGGYTRTPAGALVPRPGLRDCLSVYSGSTGLDVNTASPAVMLALGAPPEGVEGLVNLRRQMPIRRQQLGAVMGLLGPAAGRFRLGGDQIYTLRATARMRRPDGVLSDLRRTVAMTVQIYSKSSPDLYRVLAWQDQAAGQPLFSVWPQ